MISQYTQNVLNTLNQVNLGRDTVSTSNRTIDGFDWRTYYSSSDVRFEFDGIPVDEITSFSYRVVEPVKHHYGYNSYVRLAESRGSRMVHGTFSVNFTDPLQLFYLLDKIKKGQGPDTLNPKDSRIAKEDALLQQKIESTIAEINTNKSNTSEIIQKISVLQRSSRNSVGASKAPRKVLEAYQDSLWGSTPDKESRDVLGNDIFHTPKYNSKKNGFNIRIIYGEPGLGNTIIPNRFSSTPVSDAGVRRQNGAIKLVRGVQIMGEGQEISSTGESIQCVYEFIAADIN